MSVGCVCIDNVYTACIIELQPTKGLKMTTKLMIEVEVYFCAFCRIAILGTSCQSCNRYDGAIEAAEWDLLLKGGF
jgi:hypothetical protein